MQHINRRVAFVHDVFPAGGAERVTLDVANYLSSNGYEVYVFTTRFDEDRLPADTPINYQVIVLPERYVEESQKDADKIIEYINTLGISVLVSVARHLKYIEKIKRNTQCKLVFALHSLPFWEKEIILNRVEKRSKSSLGAKLEWLFISYPKYYIFDKAFRKVRKEIYQPSYNITDLYTVLCHDYKDKLVRLLKLNENDNKVRVIYNSQYAPRALSLNKKKQILFIGRLTHIDKRVDRLIDIWRMVSNQLPDWELLIVGDGEEKENLEKRAKLQGLTRISFEGFSNDTEAYYRSASILCLVSAFEGWPLCVTEAQSNGVVPIAFDCSAGVHSILSPSGVNGVLVPPFDLNRFAKELVALANDSDKLAQMRLNVLNKSKEYSIEVVGKMWMDLFDELIAK